MSIEVSGGLFVGCRVSDICYDDEKYEDIHNFADSHDMSVYSPWLDCDSEDCYVGFTLPNHVEVLCQEFDELLVYIKRTARQFEEITGATAMLIGIQDVF